MEVKFGIGSARLSECTNELSRIIYERWAFLLDLPPHILSPHRLEMYCAAIHAAGSPTRDVAGFLDCKINVISRPGTNQRILYNGYYGAHALKYQGVAAPDGLAISVYGPVEGRRADGGLLAQSDLVQKWKIKGRGAGERQLVLYADPAYGEGEVIMSGRKEVSELPPLEQQLNMEMARYREAIEWTFGKMAVNWRMFDLRDQLRLYLSPIGRHFLVSCILTNAHTCLHGSQVSHYYKLSPPTLEEYFKK